MRIAIVGAGFCGLATAWHLLQKHEIVIFDPADIGKNTSGIAAGLLHFYAGAHAKKNWHGERGLASTQKLLAVASEALKTPVAYRTGMLRLALTDMQRQDFTLCAQSHNDVRWLETCACQYAIKGIGPYPGIFVDVAFTVNCKLYLKGLWQACANRGAVWEKSGIKSLLDLKDFDRVVATMGAATQTLPECAHLPLRNVKGQILELDWPKHHPPLPYPLNSQAYLLMNPGNNTCLVGATFEKNFSSPDADPSVAIKELRPKLSALFPPLDHAPIISCHAGIRAVTANHLPLIGKISEKCWVLTGMGSKGLLYHALFAEELARQIS
jgi:glycine/D-amino acid oxidase-like deaminating enzyme